MTAPIKGVSFAVLKTSRHPGAAASMCRRHEQACLYPAFPAALRVGGGVVTIGIVLTSDAPRREMDHAIVMACHAGSSLMLGDVFIH